MRRVSPNGDGVLTTRGDNVLRQSNVSGAFRPGIGRFAVARLLLRVCRARTIGRLDDQLTADLAAAIGIVTSRDQPKGGPSGAVGSKELQDVLRGGARTPRHRESGGGVFCMGAQGGRYAITVSAPARTLTDTSHVVACCNSPSVSNMGGVSNRS